MKERQCLGRIKNFSRCGRKGQWLFFCHGHKWQLFLFAIAAIAAIYHAIGTFASIYSVYPEFDEKIIKKIQHIQNFN